MTESMFWVALATAIVAVVVMVIMLLRVSTRLEVLSRLSEDAQRDLSAQLAQAVSSQGQGLQTHLTTQLGVFQQGVVQTVQGAASQQGQGVATLTASLQEQLKQLAEGNEKRLAEVRATLDARLRELSAENEKKLEQMRATVDEKLQATLEQRLSESFKLVSDRLEAVHRGLGEMQQLAVGVGDLKRVLTNVKTRGTWGEMQLAMLLEQMLTPDQFTAQQETVAGTGEKVDFAIKFPGREDHPVWLPIDAKFPKEQYERLVDAAERADSDGVKAAGTELERAVREEAKRIAKYLSPPATTEFAVMYLPTEGLYAEVVRRPGLADDLQRNLRVTIAGPTTLAALLSSLQMGFRTLALEKRASEVWEVLGAVKGEFAKFGDVLAKTKKKLQEAQSTIEDAETRTRQMARKLKGVEALPGEAAQKMLGLEDAE
ncbi:DNA recombination protein RmuC [Piscinibacterium candidicorallinum]|uniref:DNA recombination protein RmuC n=1 Tax=Piscinibacterium candidicorallinum TaxID=1793872 RepID=A0ABV7H2D5_9BURK